MSTKKLPYRLTISFLILPALIVTLSSLLILLSSQSARAADLSAGSPSLTHPTMLEQHYALTMSLEERSSIDIGQPAGHPVSEKPGLRIDGLKERVLFAGSSASPLVEQQAH